MARRKSFRRILHYSNINGLTVIPIHVPAGNHNSSQYIYSQPDNSGRSGKKRKATEMRLMRVTAKPRNTVGKALCLSPCRLSFTVTLSKAMKTSVTSSPLCSLAGAQRSPQSLELVPEAPVL